MMTLTKTKLSLCLVGLFLAGMVTGGTLGWSIGRQRPWRPPSAERIREHLRDAYVRELGLTSDQERKLDEVLRRRVEACGAIHQRSIQQTEAAIEESNREMGKTLGLTADQQRRLELVERQRRERFERHRMGPGPGGKGMN